MATNIEGDSAHAVAYRLLEKIMVNETKDTHPERSTAFRKYALDLYRECLEAAGGIE